MEAAASEEGPEEYGFLIQGEFIINDNITVENTMKPVLYWIGLRVASSQQALVEDAFGSFNHLRMLTKKYISTMASNYSNRTQANVRMNFGTTRIKYIKAFTH